MDFNRTAQLGRFRALKVHEERRSSSLFRSSFQDECFRATSNNGAHRYLVGKEETEKRRIREIFFWVALLVLKKKIWDLSRFREVFEVTSKAFNKE